MHGHDSGFALAGLPTAAWAKTILFCAAGQSAGEF
jgi:hypothetical protein